MNRFKTNCFVLLNKNIIVFLFILSSIFHCSLAVAKDGEKIAVLYSYQNVDAYTRNNIVGFYEVWKNFSETFEESYLNYQFICNISSDTKVLDIGANVIFFPLAVDLSIDEENFLNNFIQSGGNLIITGGIGPFSESFKRFLSKHGLVITENTIAKKTLHLSHKNPNLFFDLPAGNFYSTFKPVGPERRVEARWEQNNDIAIGGTNNLVYLGYSWGQDIDKFNDIKVLLATLNYFGSDVSSRLTRKISEDEYKRILKEIAALKEEADIVIKIAKQLNLTVPEFKLNKHFQNGIDFLNSFNSNYFFGNYKLSREDADTAKKEFSLVYSLGIPSRKVEVRAIWLDRGTIVSMKDANSLRKLIKDLANTGFNIIFFETVNAGYPIYPSKLLPQNPLIMGWDPLQIAIESAHVYGLELHAWVWTFAVGNTRHNLLIDKPVHYPGPIIEEKGRAWSLSGEDGKLRVEEQPEFWVSPANKKACKFLQELFSEIVSNYDVDGLQFDYIRYPFQKGYSQVGLDFVTRKAYKGQTGKLPSLDGPEFRAWVNWKALQVSDFVKETSYLLRKIKPNLKLSVAVFAVNRYTRMRIIHQDWETWLVNRWVDVVYPFYYSYSKEEVKNLLSYMKRSVNDHAIIPAFNLRVLSEGELAERITQARNAGVLGTALFAAEHLNQVKKRLLVNGPFREKTLFVPYEKPLLACQKLLEEYSLMVEKIVSKQTFSVLSEKKTEKEVFELTQSLKNDLENYMAGKEDAIIQQLSNLQGKVKDWLALEKYLDREQRAMYLTSYLEQIKTLLSYMKSEA